MTLMATRICNGGASAYTRVRRGFRRQRRRHRAARRPPARHCAARVAGTGTILQHAVEGGPRRCGDPAARGRARHGARRAAEPDRPAGRQVGSLRARSSCSARAAWASVYKARDRRLDRTVADQVHPRRRSEPDDAPRARGARAGAASITPTSAASTRSARSRAARTSRCSSSTASRSARAAAQMSLDEKIAVMRDVARRHPRGAQARHRPPRPQAGQHHGRAQRRRPLAADRHGLRPRARGHARGRPHRVGRAHSARRRTCRPSRRAATSAPSIAAPTSTASAPRSTSCSTGRPPFAQRVAGAGARRRSSTTTRRRRAAWCRRCRSISRPSRSSAWPRIRRSATPRRARSPTISRATSTASRSSGAARRCGSGCSMRARRHRALFALGAWSAGDHRRARRVRRALLDRVAPRARAQQSSARGSPSGSGRTPRRSSWLLRAAYQLPLHDTRPERELIRARMRRSRRRRTTSARSATPSSTTRSAAATSRCTSGRPPPTSWRAPPPAGLDTPELHAARGRALGELYHRALEEARRSGDKAWLAARAEGARAAVPRAGARRARAEPRGAADERGAARGADRALPPRLRDRRDARARPRPRARRGCSRRASSPPTPPTPPAVGRRRSRQLRRRAPALERASALYAQASEVARSRRVGLRGGGAGVARSAPRSTSARAARRSEPLEHALDAVDRALAADPDDATAYTTKAYVLLRWYRAPTVRRQRRSAAAARAHRGARPSARSTLDPRDAGAWDALGNAHVYRGIYEMYHGGKGEPWWRRVARRVRQGARDPAQRSVGQQRRSASRIAGSARARATRAAIRCPSIARRSPSYAARHRRSIRSTCTRWSNQADIEASIAEYQRRRADAIRAPPSTDARARRRALPGDRSQLLRRCSTRWRRPSCRARAISSTPAAIRRRRWRAARGYLDRADRIHPDNMTRLVLRARRRRPRGALSAAHAAAIAAPRSPPGAPRSSRRCGCSAELRRLLGSRRRGSISSTPTRAHGDAPRCWRARAPTRRRRSRSTGSSPRPSWRRPQAVRCGSRRRRRSRAVVATGGIALRRTAALALNPRLADGEGAARRAAQLQRRLRSQRCSAAPSSSPVAGSCAAGYAAAVAASAGRSSAARALQNLAMHAGGGSSGSRTTRRRGPSTPRVLSMASVLMPELSPMRICVPETV